MNPFLDDPIIMSDPLSYWQSKLNVAQELAEFALFLFSVPVSEAAVERIFSVQKFLDTPLRNALEEKRVGKIFVKVFSNAQFH